MDEYQSRVIGPNGNLSLMIFAIHANNRSAIRSATRFCRSNETVSVWCDDLCIYDELPKAGLWFVWPIVSANPKSIPTQRERNGGKGRKCDLSLEGNSTAGIRQRGSRKW